jgi:hypothetical protein
MGKRARQTATGRLGLVFYWIGCTIAALMAIIIGFVIYEHGLDDPLPWIGCIIAAVSFAIGRALLFILGNE